MKTRKIFSLPILIISVLILLVNASVAQRLSYSDTELTDKFYDVVYKVGKVDDSVVVWLYQRSENRLQVNVFTHAMHLLSKTTYKFSKNERLLNIQFLNPSRCCDVLIQYFSNNKIVTRVFSFDKAAHSIVPSAILQKSELLAGITLTNSTNGQYTGMIRQYAVGQDSLMVQYSLYNKAFQLIKNVPLLLPYKPDFINLGNSLTDDYGNLFFYTIQNAKDAIQQQEITVYKLNVATDSLLTSRIVRNGMFLKAVLQQSRNSNDISMSGVWKSDGYAPAYAASALRNDYFFLATFIDNLKQKGDTKYYLVTSIVDSVLASRYLFSSSNVISKNDSTSILYISGIANYSSKPAGNYFTPGTKPDIPYIGSFFQDRLNTIANGGFSVAPNIPNVYGTAGYGTNSYQAQPYNLPPSNYNNSRFAGSTLAQTALSGESFFLAMTVTESGITAIKPFKDEADIRSAPQFEYVTSLGENVHYLYSRTEKKDRQLIFDLTVDKNGNMNKKPVVNNPKLRLSLTDGIKISSNCIVFPYYHNYSLSLARMDIE